MSDLLLDLFKHGELLIAEVLEPASEAKEISVEEDLKIADSETTGNFHMLEHVPGLHVWQEDKADEFFVRADEGTKIYCKLDNRHTDLHLPAGKTFHITPAQEWDHINQERRNVLD